MQFSTIKARQSTDETYIFWPRGVLGVLGVSVCGISDARVRNNRGVDTAFGVDGGLKSIIRSSLLGIFPLKRTDIEHIPFHFHSPVYSRNGFASCPRFFRFW